MISFEIRRLIVQIENYFMSVNEKSKVKIDRLGQQEYLLNECHILNAKNSTKSCIF